VNAAKRAQKIAHRRPQSFNGIGMDFPDPIPTVIPRPFLSSMTDRAVPAVNARIALPLVGIAPGLAAGVLMDMGVQGRPVRVLAHPQPTPPRAPTNRADHRRPISGRGTVSSALVGTPARRIVRIRVLFAFFPQPSGPARLSRSLYPAQRPPLTRDSRWRVASAVRGAPCSDIPPVPPRAWDCSRPYTRRAPAVPLGEPITHSPQRLSRCRDCRPDRTAYRDNQASPAWSAETPAPVQLRSGSADSQSPAGENTARSSGYSLRRPIMQ